MYDKIQPLTLVEFVSRSVIIKLIFLICFQAKKSEFKNQLETCIDQ